LRQLLDRGKTVEEQRFIQHIQNISGAGVRKGLEDARANKTRMDAELMERQFSGWQRLLISFEGPICVASTGASTPNRDFAGNELQRLHEFTSQLQPLYFGSIRTERGGVLVFLWRPEYDAPRRFLEDFQRLQLEHLPSMLVQFMFAYIENTFFAAEWWESLSESIKEHLVGLARMGNPYYSDWKYIPDRFVPWRVTKIASTYSAA
jgi:hypothetical protein